MSGDDKKNLHENEDSPKASWWESWFEGNYDVRKDIHQQLNDFEEDQKRGAAAAAFSFPSFGSFPRFQEPTPEWRDFEEEVNRVFGNSREDSKINRNNLHKEFQSLFEEAFGGMHHHSTSTTMVSNSNGTSYRMHQDSKNGTTVDLRLPDAAPVTVEVLEETPCLIQWKQNKQRQILDLGTSVDCSQVSASLSKAQKTLTLKAPPRSDSEANNTLQQQCPRSIPVSKNN